jgi:ABC-type transport system involved in multi-copper enzyme maturation permease subunit
MKVFLDILRFELRLHLKSPLFAGVALVLFALHLLTQARIGINLGTNELLALNGAWLIFQTQLVLGAVGMIPAIVFAVTAITRDHERNTLELFFTTQVPRRSFLLGRLTAGTLVAVLIALTGMLGALTGTLIVGPDRLGPFAWRPWVVCFGALVLPNVLVFCVLFFSVGALTRSTAVTFGAALAGLALEVVAAGTAAAAPVAPWQVLADPFGGLAITEVSRYWTVAELNTLLPVGLLLPNRLLWLAGAAAVLTLTCRRYRMELVHRSLPQFRPGPKAPGDQPPALSTIAPHLRFDGGATLRLFASQFRMDWRGVWQSPVFWIVLVIATLANFNDAANHTSLLANLPLYPATTLMFGFFRYGLSVYVQLLVIWYSAALIHRERDSGMAGMSGAVPCPDWIPVVAKTAVLCGVVMLLLAGGMASSIAAQALGGFDRFEIGLYLEGLFLYNGFYFCMHVALAALIQIVSPGKWSGMLLTLLAFIGLAALSAFGFEHLLYSFHIPAVTHSDMNGFGHYAVQTYALIAYWGAFCALLLLAGHLFFPRGDYASLREHLNDARSRVTAPVVRAAAVAFAAFASVGGFIFYNTNVLNDYRTSNDRLAAQARYERDYGRYRNAPAPVLTDPDIRVELYPSVRRMESRGTAGLLNDTGVLIEEFLVRVDLFNRVDELLIEGATLVASDPAQGTYLFRPDAPFAPGASLPMRWALVRAHRGFPNSNADDLLAANGTYLRVDRNLPAPGYCVDCEITSHRDRARFRLPPRERLPALGDPGHLDDLWPGISTRSSMHAIIGTEADQTAVAPGDLRRTWEEHGRRYFEYSDEGPVWPLLSVMSARYTVARADWNGVAVEVYHDPKHPWNIPTMLATAQKGLEYYSREFGPFAHSYYRMVEYPRYRTAVEAGAGMVAYSEISGFMTDLRDWVDLDYATLHELAHQWWGNVYGANMQGRQFLNEGLAQYSTFMAYKQFADPAWVRRILAMTHDGYLNARSSEQVAEQPVLLTEDQGYISYNKAALGLFALQELIGATHVNGALRAYYERFLPMRPPLPTSRDLIDELRKVAGPGYQQFITDYFEKIMLYDAQVTSASVRRVDNQYEVTLDISAQQFEADGIGNETEVPLDTWFEVVIFPDSAEPRLEQTPLYKKQHRLHSGSQRVIVRVPQAPGSAGVDPFHLMIDRQPDNNVRAL